MKQEQYQVVITTETGTVIRLDLPADVDERLVDEVEDYIERCGYDLDRIDDYEVIEKK